ncbi:MAG: hypothetical protein PHH69_03515 [Candidatus Omnitrophica bacterium]|nr:hypothetical protein [Candidatus Omnitrophota bacterium]
MPLSDQEICNYFKREEIAVSRRTITKYRHQLKILILTNTYRTTRTSYYSTLFLPSAYLQKSQS